MNSTVRWLVIIGAGVLVGVILLCALALLLWFFVSPQQPGFSFSPLSPRLGGFDSNGERIYFTGTSQTGPPISSTMPGMHRMDPGSQACANCHGADGRGGRVTMMMTSVQAPDIRYSTLTEGEHDDAHGDEEHPPYTDETIIRAITQGVDPAGDPLNWVMPRWEMSDEQLDDLLDFLKTLD